ncbi:PucR family transcriptional regulator [Metabacillus idriensis]|uniref:PucR family transcriptional regulator n=1 Tax=Metabacillus idriensis TaxID=324768 RepID=UPI003D282010
MNKPANEAFNYHADRLEDVADRISEVLQCPITIEDINHRLLAYSTHDDCTDPARISTIIGRRVPEKVINSLWRDGTIPMLLQTDEPIRVKNIDEVGLGNRIAISIWKNNEVLGFIWALEINKKLTDDELELLKKAAQVVKNKLLNLHNRKSKKEERNQEFFWKLLTGHIHEENDIINGFHTIGITPPAQHSVVLFRFSDEIKEPTEKQINYLLQTTQQVQIILSTQDQNELIILLAPKSGEPLSDIKQFVDWTILQLKERFMIDDVKAGIGSIYKDAEQIELSYKEAIAVQNIKKRFVNETKGLISFSELGIYQYLDLLNEKRKQEGFVNYPLRKLKEYDEMHHTNLVETLEVYLDKDSNVNDAAKALNVHVNTLSYRIKRISQIAELDLRDPNQKITVYLNLKLDKMSL